MHKLDEAISPNHLLKHPFYQRWMEGTLSRPELQRYAANYYPHVKAFPTYVSAVHSLCEDMSLRQELLENLIEEERGEENHPELWLRFAEAIGVDREHIRQSDCIPEAKKLVDTFQRLTRKSVPSGLGALYAYESQVPAIAEQKIHGLKKNYGVEQPRGLQFFAVHQQADVWHSQTARDAIDRLSQKEQDEAMESAQQASQALWNFLSGLDRHSGIAPGPCEKMHESAH